jgi:lactobin A/cerein 7B family class IIb bacteriocin
MRELTFDEIEGVSGGRMAINTALELIGGIAAVCAVVPGLQGAAAFGAGVYFGGTAVLAWAEW